MLLEIVSLGDSLERLSVLAGLLSETDPVSEGLTRLLGASRWLRGLIQFNSIMKKNW